MKSNHVLVLSNTLKPLMPCHPARARELLRKGKAAVYRMQPFTIILKFRSDGDTQPLTLKVDPASKASGLALVASFLQRGPTLLWAADLYHRGQVIVSNLLSRRSVRSTRRSRNTRYRAPRFLNRTRAKGWLPPSLLSRVNNITVWVSRLISHSPVSTLHVESHKFDTQKLDNPSISGIEYQQGTLAGYEVREYLLEKYNRTCVYCGKSSSPFHVEHIIPKSKGGSDRLSNLVLSCESCDRKKASTPIQSFLKSDPLKLNSILSSLTSPLKHAAALNSIRNRIVKELSSSFSLPLSTFPGSQTKMNRLARNLPYSPSFDAASIGPVGSSPIIDPTFKPLTIKATGRGTHQVVMVDKYGSPRAAPIKHKRLFGFQTGDIVKMVKPSNPDKGTYIGRLASVSSKGAFYMKLKGVVRGCKYTNFTLLQNSDGYAYT